MSALPPAPSGNSCAVAVPGRQAPTRASPGSLSEILLPLSSPKNELESKAAGADAGDFSLKNEKI